MKYKDFDITIEGKHGDEYDVSINSPAGEGSSKLLLPFTTDEAIDMLASVGQIVRGLDGGVAVNATRSDRMDSGVEVDAGDSPTVNVGQILFDKLFTGATRSLLDKSLGMISSEEDTGLRIKLTIDPRNPDVAELASLPWELLYKEDTKEYLNLSRSTPLVRYLKLQQASEKITFVLPLRILVVTTLPEGVAKLDLEKEEKLIRDNWAKLDDVEVEFLKHATIKRLNDELANNNYHVLHFMGHGDFDPVAGKGVLVFEDEDGNPQHVDGTTMGVVLRDIKTLQLVVLNACNTAKASDQRGKDPFAGVATAMVMAGVPAVVAMQFPISDKAAVEFAGTFYPRLAKGMPIDSAVSEGRKAIRLLNATSMEWATPVLFMRSKDGVLFDVPVDDDGTVVTPPVPTPAPQPTPEPVVQTPTVQKPNPVPWSKVGLFGGIPLAIIAAAVWFFFLRAPSEIEVKGSSDVFLDQVATIELRGQNIEQKIATAELHSENPDVVAVVTQPSVSAQGIEFPQVQGMNIGKTMLHLISKGDTLLTAESEVGINPDMVAKANTEYLAIKAGPWQAQNIGDKAILDSLNQLTARYRDEVLTEAKITDKLATDKSALQESIAAFRVADSSAYKPHVTIRDQLAAWQMIPSSRNGPDQSKRASEINRLEALNESNPPPTEFRLCVYPNRSNTHCRNDVESFPKGTKVGYSMKVPAEQGAGSYRVRITGPELDETTDSNQVNSERFWSSIARVPQSGEYVVSLYKDDNLVDVKRIRVP